MAKPPKNIPVNPNYLGPVSGQALPDRLQLPTSIKDGDDPASLVNIAPPELEHFIVNIPEELMGLDEKELHTRVKPDDMLCRLRIAFWDEYQQAHNTGCQMLMANIVRGCCTQEYFYKWVAAKPLKMRWIIQVPKNYYLAMREMLDLGLGKLREILDLPIMIEKKIKTGKDEYGNFTFETVMEPNTKVISEMRAITTLLDQRVKGAIVQRLAIQQQSINYNVEGTPANIEGLDLKGLEALENKIAAITSGLDKVDKGRIIEVGSSASESEESLARSASDAETARLLESGEE